MEAKQMWTLLQETMGSFTPFYREGMRKAAQEAGLPAQWFGLHLARGSDPVPFALGHLLGLVPYGAPGPLAEGLEELAGKGFLEQVDEGSYRVTDKGRQAIEAIFTAAHEGIAMLAPLPAGEMARLNQLLQRVVETILNAPEPREKWSLVYSRWTDYGPDPTGSVKTDQYLTDLVRFRDDAHLAAWKPYGVSGPAWEALTFLWRGDAQTAAELAEKLPFRGLTADAYQKALDELAGKGWVAAERGVCQLTEAGRRVREEAEQATDRYFFAGWAALSGAEVAQLEDLLTRTRSNLRMATLQRLWGFCREVSQAIYAATRSTVEPLMQRLGMDQPGFFQALYVAHRVEPDAISASRMGLRDPYSNAARYQTLLSRVAEAGLLEPAGGDEYWLSDQGRTVLRQAEHPFYLHLGEVQLLSAEELVQMEGFLRRIVEACLEAQEPASRWCISTSHRGHPREEYGPLARIDQHLDDLNAFRDDAHLAAWKGHDVDGPAWEALTYVWRGDAHTAAELAEKLPFRGHSAESYAEALAGLTARGWMEVAGEGFRLSQEGQELRQQVEESTDRYFFAPWSCLSGPEMVQLCDLLARARDGLQQRAQQGTGTG